MVWLTAAARMVPTRWPNGASSLTGENLERHSTNHKTKGVRTEGINGKNLSIVANHSHSLSIKRGRDDYKGFNKDYISFKKENCLKKALKRVYSVLRVYIYHGDWSMFGYLYKSFYSLLIFDNILERSICQRQRFWPAGRLSAVNSQ